LPRGRVART